VQVGLLQSLFSTILHLFHSRAEGIPFLLEISQIALKIVKFTFVIVGTLRDGLGTLFKSLSYDGNDPFGSRTE